MKKIGILLCLCWICPAVFSQAPVSVKSSVTRQWVEENPDSVRRMSRTEWLQINDYALQKACFAQFTTEQRLAFWVAKLREVCCLDWNPQEKTHIDDMIKFMLDHPYIFSVDDEFKDENEQILMDYTLVWQKKAVEQFGWSRRTIGAMLMEGNQMLTKEGELAGPPRVCD